MHMNARGLARIDSVQSAAAKRAHAGAIDHALALEKIRVHHAAAVKLPRAEAGWRSQRHPVFDEAATVELRRAKTGRRGQRVLPLRFDGVDVLLERVHPRVDAAGASAFLDLFLLLRIVLADLLGLRDRRV